MRLGFRTTLIIAGALLIFLSGYLGDWAIWLGGPVLFSGIIFKYLDRS